MDNKPTESAPSTSALGQPPSQSQAAPAGELVALNPREKISLKLMERIEVSHNSRIFRFALPSPEHRLGLPCGKHVFVYAKVWISHFSIPPSSLPCP